MSLTYFIICVAAVSTVVNCLPWSNKELNNGPDPLQEHDLTPASTKRLNVRQAYTPYFPYYSFVPPVYQVHNIVLYPPTHCPPQQAPQPTAPTFPSRPQRPDTTDLGPKFGNERPDTNTTDPSTNEVDQPSRCVWSIVACCAPGSRNIRYTCFELLGCPGAFWDVNPCEKRVVAAAANTALNFYMQNESPTPPPSFTLT